MKLFSIFIYEINFRLANGSTLTQTFGAKEQLAAVRLFIDLKRAELDISAIPEQFRIQTNFPRKIFDEDARRRAGLSAEFVAALAATSPVRPSGAPRAASGT